jgi:hypothetical protein
MLKLGLNFAIDTRTYPLLLWARGDDVVHQIWHDRCHPVNASGEAAICGGAADRLALLLGVPQPFADYRVDDVEDTKLM